METVWPLEYRTSFLHYVFNNYASFKFQFYIYKMILNLRNAFDNSIFQWFQSYRSMTDWRKQIVKTNQAFRNAISFSNNSEELVNDFLALFIQPLFSFCCVQTKYQIITESPDLQLPFHLIGLAIKALLPNNSGEKKKDTFPCSRLFGHYLGWIESLKIRWTQTEFCCCPTQSEHQILYKDIHTYIRIHIRIHAQSL